MDVGLPVRDHDDLIALQLGSQERAQSFRIPAGLRSLRPSILVLQVVHASPDLGGQGCHFRRGRHRPQQAFAAQQAANAGHPASPAELRDDHRDQRDDQAECADEEEQVPPRVLAAPIDETHVVQEYQLGDWTGFAVDRVYADVDRTPRQSKARLAEHGHGLRLLAVQGARKAGAAANHRSIERTEADGEEALVLHHTIEEDLQAGAFGVADRISDRIGQCVGHQAAPRVQVAGEPAQREAIHHGQGEIRGRDERHEQWRKKAELEVERLHGITPAAPGAFAIIAYL